MRGQATKQKRPTPKAGRDLLLSVPYLSIIGLALSGMIAVVGTVTVVGTLSAQSSWIGEAAADATWFAPTKPEDVGRGTGCKPCPARAGPRSSDARSGRPVTVGQIGA